MKFDPAIKNNRLKKKYLCTDLLYCATPICHHFFVFICMFLPFHHYLQLIRHVRLPLKITNVLLRDQRLIALSLYTYWFVLRIQNITISNLFIAIGAYENLYFPGTKIRVSPYGCGTPFRFIRLIFKSIRLIPTPQCLFIKN